MTLKMFSEDHRFIAQSDRDMFVIKITDEHRSVNYFLDDEDVRELQALCKCHLQNKKSEKEE